MKNNTQNFTEKDLAYIRDMFQWNLETLKLARHFLGEVEGEEVRELLEDVAKVHYDHLNFCIQILNGTVSSACDSCMDEDYEEEEEEDEEDYEEEETEEDEEDE